MKYESINHALLLKRSLYKESYYDFFKAFWGIVSPSKLEESKYHKYLCDEVQTILEWTADFSKQNDKSYNLLINISPGMSKSTIISKLAPLWQWVINPNTQIIQSSYGVNPIKEFTDKFLVLLRSEEFRRIFPEIRLRVENIAEQRNIYKGTRYTTTVGGGITGLHGDIILIDDPNQPPEITRDEHGRPQLRAGARLTEIKAANSWFDDKISTRKTSKQYSRFIIVQQRVHKMDFSGYLLEKAKRNFPLKHICLPIDQPENAFEKTYINGKLINQKSLKHLYSNEKLLDPKRVNQKVLEEEKAVMGSFIFEAQHRQNPKNERGGVLKRKFFPIIKRSELPDNLVSFFYTDPSEGKLTSDNMATACWSLWEGKVYIREMMLKREEFGVFVGHRDINGNWIKKSYDLFVEKHNQNEQSIHFFEAKSSGSAYLSKLKTETPYNAIPDIPQGSKMDRISLALPRIESGRVVLVEGDWIEEFFEEIESFTGKDSDQDDQVDVLSAIVKLTDFGGSAFTKKENEKRVAGNDIDKYTF
jgi:predicted phage terminase large subunit-like protein